MRKLTNAVAATVLRLYPRRMADDVRVVFTDLDVDRDMCVERLRAALHILLEADARRHKQVVRYVRQVVVWPGAYTAADRIGGIQLSSEHLMEISDVQLASVLVHESVHLRISRFGIEYEKRLRERIERRCVREQASFLRRLAGGDELAREAEAALQLEWWSDEAHQADLNRLVADASLPRWVIPLIDNRRTR